MLIYTTHPTDGIRHLREIEVDAEVEKQIHSDFAESQLSFTSSPMSGTYEYTEKGKKHTITLVFKHIALLC